MHVLGDLQGVPFVVVIVILRRKRGLQNARPRWGEGGREGAESGSQKETGNKEQGKDVREYPAETAEHRMQDAG